jgi:hypothetical protein
MVGAVLLAAVGVAQTLWERQRLLAVLTDQKSLIAAQTENVRIESAARPKPETDPKAEQAVQAISRELNVPWLQLVDTVQAVAGSAVTLSRMQPDPVTARMQIEGQAASVDEFLEYLRRLQDRDILQQVAPVSVDPEGSAVRFQVVAGWSTVP